MFGQEKERNGRSTLPLQTHISKMTTTLTNELLFMQGFPIIVDRSVGPFSNYPDNLNSSLSLKRYGNILPRSINFYSK